MVTKTVQLTDALRDKDKLLILWVRLKLADVPRETRQALKDWAGEGGVLWLDTNLARDFGFGHMPSVAAEEQRGTAKVAKIANDITAGIAGQEVGYVLSDDRLVIEGSAANFRKNGVTALLGRQKKVGRVTRVSVVCAYRQEGKGLIEVTKVGLTLSECRIVQKGEGDLVKGDVVVNPVYARGKRMKFFVFGSFDLDSDGRADARGLERMKQLIAKWGGEVVGKINVNTDYGVMGMEPELPSKPGPDADPITQQQYKNKKAKYDQYKQQLANLRGLSIPVLNQNRFLSFIGYYESQASH